MPLYLAMTAAEISGCQQLPEPLAYMACHFSPYSTGLSNLPGALPKGSMVILNDRIPICGHDPRRVAEQLGQLCEELEAESLLLDLQRTDENMHAIIAQILKDRVCPVGVSELYAKDFDCPVFLSAPPLHIPLAEYAAPWEGHEIWLEAATDQYAYGVSETACVSLYADYTAPLPCGDLCCHYGFHEEKDRLVIALERTWEDLQMLMKDDSITKSIGLYQQLGKQKRLLPEETAATI